MDPITRYQQAVQGLLSAIAGAERLSQMVSNGAPVLRNWRGGMVSNSQVGFPAELALGPTPSINASEWPTGQQIAEALGRYHKAKSELRMAYDAIPDARWARSSLPPEHHDKAPVRSYM